jgi:glycosyltransferase involved in cell wall biosynthesis
LDNKFLTFSILMPTYNNEKYIVQAVQSVLEQDDQSWELIIVNDGSTDNTEEKIKAIKDQRIRYIYQKNADQLNALVRASKIIKGDIIILLHSDDMLNGCQTLTKLRREFEADSTLVGLFGDYTTIDEQGEETGVSEAPLFRSDRLLKAIYLYWGANLIGDHFVVRNDYFFSNIYPNYLIDNTIYYLSHDRPILNGFKKIASWYRYRVFEGNYLNTEIGKYVAISGQLRTLSKLVQEGYFIQPFLPQNLFLFKVIRKWFSYLWRFRKEEEIKWAQAARYYSLWKRALEAMHYPALLIQQISKIIHSAEIRMYNNHKKPLYISYTDEKMYYGKDARSFFRDSDSAGLNAFYFKLLNEDYDHVIVTDDRSLVAVQEALKFFSFFYPVERTMAFS